MAGKAKGDGVLIIPGVSKGYKDKKAAKNSFEGEKAIFEVKVKSGAVDVSKYLADGDKLPEGDLPACLF